MVKLTTTVVLFVLFVIPAVFASTIKMIPEGVQPGYDGRSRVSIQGEKTYEQTFISKENNLTAVGTSIKNPNLKNKSEIIFNLYDENKNLIRTTKFNGFNLEDGSFFKIVFEPVEESKDKQFTFSLSSPDAKGDEVIELFIIEKQNTALSYMYSSEIKEGGAPIVLYHKTTGMINNIVMVYKNLFIKE